MARFSSARSSWADPPNPRRSCGERDTHLDVRADDAAQHALGLGDDDVGVTDGDLAKGATTEVQELLREGGGALTSAPNLFELDACVLGRVREQDVRVAIDHREQVVEVVRDAPGELAYGLEMARHRQLGFQSLARGLHRPALGDVAARGLDDDEVTVAVEGALADQMDAAAPAVGARLVLALHHRRLPCERLDPPFIAAQDASVSSSRTVGAAV